MESTPRTIGMNFAMAAGTKATAVCAIAFSMPLCCMMPVNTPAASRIEAISSAARACASIRCRCMSTSR